MVPKGERWRRMSWGVMPGGIDDKKRMPERSFGDSIRVPWLDLLGFEIFINILTNRLYFSCICMISLV